MVFWFLDVHTPPGLFSCKPSKATAGKWVSSCKARTHYVETKPFLGAAKHLLSCKPPEAVQSLFSLHHGFNRKSPFISLTFTFIFQRYLFFPDHYEQCCHQSQTSVLVENWACTSESDVKYSQIIFGTRHHESLSLVGWTVLSLLIVWAHTHKESHKHQQDSLVCKLITK